MSGQARTSRSPRAVVFDTDGVLLDSAAVHAAAWKSAFDACLDPPAPKRSALRGEGAHLVVPDLAAQVGSVWGEPG